LNYFYFFKLFEYLQNSQFHWTNLNMLKRLIKLNKKTNFHSNSLFLNSEKLPKVAQTSPFDTDLEKEKQYRFENIN
jgi:hypothetical protein